MLDGFGWLQKNITFNRSGGVTEWHKRLSFNHVAGNLLYKSGRHQIGWY